MFGIPVNSIMQWGQSAWTAGKQLWNRTSGIRSTIGGFLGIAQGTPGQQGYIPGSGLFATDDKGNETFGINQAQRVDASQYGSPTRSVYKAAKVDADNLGLTQRVMDKWQAAANSNIPSIKTTMKRTPPIPKQGVTIRIS